MKNNLRMLILCGLFTALIIVGAYIKIPLPPVPFTAQSLFVILSGLLLGRRYGTISVILYAVLGVAGFPVFSGGSGGLGAVFTPTFGYIIGFIFAAFVCGFVSKGERASFKKLLAASFSGMAVIYICGMVYYYFLQILWFDVSVDLKDFIISFCLLTLPKDIAICFISAFIAKRLSSVPKSP